MFRTCATPCPGVPPGPRQGLLWGGGEGVDLGWGPRLCYGAGGEGPTPARREAASWGGSGGPSAVLGEAAGALTPYVSRPTRNILLTRVLVSPAGEPRWRQA